MFHSSHRTHFSDLRVGLASCLPRADQRVRTEQPSCQTEWLVGCLKTFLGRRDALPYLEAAPSPRRFFAIFPHSLLLVAALWLAGCRTSAQETNSPAPQRFVLKPSAVWQINLPADGRFDSSALMLQPNGELWTLCDNHTNLYRIDFPKGTNIASLTVLPQFLKPSQLAPFNKDKIDRYDIEGLTRDDQGRIYICEEANRWILRMSPDGSSLERLAIDWSPVAKYFDPKDGNASFEGVAVIGNRLFVANERSLPRIIVVDLTTLKVIDDFCPTYNIPLINEAHFSDLAAYKGRLFILVRSRAQILEVDPANKRVVAEYDWSACQRDPEFAYLTRFNTGNMEGLAVDAGGFWMVTDNNGLGRKAHPDDIRPTLFRCPWPK